MFKLQHKDFEGPIELLLYFVYKNKMNPLDIELGRLIDEFENYLSIVDKDLKEQSEFIFMVSILVKMKLNALLNRDNEREIKVSVDEVIERYRELYRNGVNFLKQKDKEESLTVPLGNRLLMEGILPPQILKNVLFSIDRKRKNVFDENMTVEMESVDFNKIERFVIETITARRYVMFTDIIKEATRILIVAMFFVILELAREGMLKLFQRNNDIMIVNLKKEA